MKDAVALAYSGRIPEARAAAQEQAASDDEFVAGQGLEAIAVLGEQYGLRFGASLDAVLLRRCRESSVISRRAFEAARAVDSRVLEPEAVRRIENGEATWDVLRYAGELPSHRLGRALVTGWARLSDRLIDEALLTICRVPVANPDEAREFGRLAMDAARSRSEEIKRAGFEALRFWIPLETADICARALTDDVAAIRESAAQQLAELDPKRLIELAEEIGDASPEAVALAAAVAGREAARRATR